MLSPMPSIDFSRRLNLAFALPTTAIRYPLLVQHLSHTFLLRCTHLAVFSRFSLGAIRVSVANSAFSEACSLLPLFLDLPSFVFSALQPLVPKTGGWVYPSPYQG